MGISIGHGFEAVYQHYLAWFRERAKPGASPKEKDTLLGWQSFHEDVFENPHFILNRVYFLIPLSPAQSRSGTLEIFRFSELNLMRKAQYNGMEEIAEIYPVEYRIE